MDPGRRRGVAALLVLCAVFLVTRFFRLLSLPMFIDESIYLFWARRIVADGRFWRPLADGKSLHVWLLALVVPWVSEPLWWGRAVSILAGGVGMGAAWALGQRLMSDRAGLIAAGLYVLCPFALFHDRMVLADVLLSSAAALTLLASLSLVDRPSTHRGVALGLALTACVLCKIPGLLVFTTALLTWWLLPKRPGIGRALGVAYGLAIALSAFPILYFFRNSAQVQEQAALPGGDAGPAAVVAQNLVTVGEWLWTYWTPAVCAVGSVAFIAAVIGRRREELLLGACVLVPIAAFVLLSRSWFPRYVLFATIPFLVLTALALSRLVSQVKGLMRSRGGWWVALPVVLALAALIYPAFSFDWPLLVRPETAPFPDVERLQYVDGWMAGYGREEVVRAVARERARSPHGIVVEVGGAVKHGWRPLHLMLRARFMNDPGVDLQVGDVLAPSNRASLLAQAEGRPVFIAFAVDGEGAPTALGRPLVVDRRPDGTVATMLYRLSPDIPSH
jgi:4-amino-4-deoxy-L-arabinose transferase-like glycosyltransferase